MKVKAINESSKYHSRAIDMPEFSWASVNALQRVKAALGWQRLNFSEGKWRFSEDVVIDLLRGEGVEVEIVSAIPLPTSPVLAIKEKKETDFEPLGCKGQMYPFQKVGVEFMVANGGRALNAGDMGTGKSVQALITATHLGLKKIVVFCPPFLKYNWEGEVEKWTNYRPYVVKAKDKITLDLWRKHDVFIIHYTIANRFSADLATLRPDIIIADEATALKNMTAQRTKAVREVARATPRFIALTGTPIENRPAELFSILNLIDPIRWKNRWAFLQRYCAPQKSPWGWKFEGASNMKELRAFIDPYYIRKTKAEVLDELPARIFATVPVELDSDTAKKYKEAEEDFTSYAERHEGKSYVNEALVKLGVLRQLASIGKIESASEFIETLAENEKAIVFSSYNEPLRQLRDYFGEKAVYITGEVDMETRNEDIKRFKTDPECRVFLGGYKSAGMGLTLTEATATVLLDYPWVPADLAQAIDRNYRISQTKGVVVHQMVSKGTIDEHMVKILARKQKYFDDIFAKEGEDGFKMTMADELIEMAKKRS